MRWFLPETPDVLGLLRTQLALTIEGMDAFAEWADGTSTAERAVRDDEHLADAAKRELYRTLRSAFVTPLEPEDVFALSRGIDRILNQAKDAVRESEVMACPPDAPLAAMATLLTQAVRALDAAVAGLAGDGSATTASRPRSKPQGASNACTAERWPICWQSTTYARSRHAASSTGAAPASPTRSSTSPSACCTRW
jgi:hypothetical protein